MCNVLRLPMEKTKDEYCSDEWIKRNDKKEEQSKSSLSDLEINCKIVPVLQTRLRMFFCVDDEWYFTLWCCEVWTWSVGHCYNQKKISQVAKLFLVSCKKKEAKNINMMIMSYHLPQKNLSHWKICDCRLLLCAIKTLAMTRGQTCNKKTPAQKLISSEFLTKELLSPYSDMPLIRILKINAIKGLGNIWTFLF